MFNLPLPRVAAGLAALTFALVLTGCEIFNALDRSGGAAERRDVLRVVNETSRPVYFLALSAEAMARVRLAATLQLDTDNPHLLDPGTATTVGFEEIAEAFGEGDTVVFTLYVPVGEAADGTLPLRLATQIASTYEALAGQDFEVNLTPAALTGDDRFGDDYRILTRAGGDGFGVEDPHLDGDSLRVWVGFGGCSEGTFTLSPETRDGTAYLTLFHDYPLPEGAVDCKRYNVRVLSFALDATVRAQPRLLLLNPNADADPYEDAFVLR